MKKINLLFLLLSFAVGAFAQHKNDMKPTHKKSRGACPKMYVTISTGLNNPTGLIGLNLDVPVLKSLSVEGGAGISTWGSKVTAGLKYYFSPCHRGWALGAGITHNTGLNNFTTNLETVYGTEEVTLNLLPQTNVYIAGYKFWNLGRRNNRIYTMLGWSIPFSNHNYDELYGDDLSSNGKTTLSILTPGGLVVGFGFSFGFGG